jgi:hypothetical protein
MTHTGWLTKFSMGTEFVRKRRLIVLFAAYDG